MREQFDGDRDQSWEVLSLLDQYYRRGKIRAEVFQAVKSRLEGSALGATEDAAPTLRAAPSKTVTAPTGAPYDTVSGKFKAAPRRAAREVTIGDVLRNRYRVQAVLGHGGMGTVFEAIDEYRLDLPTSGQRIAIKVLHTAVTQRDELLAELQREFQHLQLLSHPNIVRVHEFDRDGDVAFFTMELLRGALLGRVLSARNAIALPRPYALAIIRDVGAALSHAHSQGVVHGDINPQNIFITNDGEVRVLDFGASHKLLQNTESADGEWTERAPLATPGYASCQVLEGQHPNTRDDLFAFACVAYLLLSGEHPFLSRTAAEARAQHLTPRRPPGLTGHQWRALREGLHWERERRPGNVQEWLDSIDLRAAARRLPALSALVGIPPPRKRRRMLATTAVIGVALLAAGGYWAATDYDSLTNDITAWGAQARSGVANAGAFISHLIDNERRSAPVVVDTGKQSVVERPAAVTPDLPARPAISKQTPLPDVERPRPVPFATAATPPPAGDTPNRAANTGPVHIEMTADTVDVAATELTARVTVRRRGNPYGEANFTWWTESGTAKPGVDFAPVTPHVERFADGSNSVNLNITVSDQPRSQSKSFYVVIDRTESGPALGARTLTLVTILPPQ